MQLTRKFLLFVFALFCCVNAFALPFNQIVVLGDSLSDNGNLYKILKIVPKSPPYYQGRFTNGPSWAEAVGNYYSDKYAIDSKNYAYGGATAVIHDLAQDSFIAPMTLDGEMISYGLSSIGTDKSKVLYMIWIGANDYLYDHSPNMEEVTDRVVDKTDSVIRELMMMGGVDFVVLNLPDLAKTPFARAHHEEDRLHAITVMHNEKLRNMLEVLQIVNPTRKFVTVDVYQVFDELLAHPEKFNALYAKSLSNVMDSCWTGTIYGFAAQEDKLVRELQSVLVQDKRVDVDSVARWMSRSSDLMTTYRVSMLGATRCGNPEAYVFWDDLHPTAVVHDILGKIVVKALVEDGQG